MISSGLDAPVFGIVKKKIARAPDGTRCLSVALLPLVKILSLSFSNG